MRKSRFTDEQIIKALKEHAAADCQLTSCAGRHGLVTPMFHKWRSRYGGMEIPDARKLKALEDETPAEEAAGGVDARRVGAEGSAGKKLTRSAEIATLRWRS